MLVCNTSIYKIEYTIYSDAKIHSGSQDFLESSGIKWTQINPIPVG